jgi:thiamine biosynthesis protein ThiS
MRVLVNGETRELPSEISLSGLLDQLALPARRIAVEINKVVVRRQDWEEIKISDDDKIEIVHFVGGG